MNNADFLEHWGQHLTNSRRRSPHTVRAYLACAERLLNSREFREWEEIGQLKGADLRSHLAARRAEGIGNATAARELSALKGFITLARGQSGALDCTTN